MKKLALIFTIFALKLSGQIGPPDLRCIEVLNNGDAKLTWIPASDPNNVFDSYEIFSSIAFTGPYASVGAVAGLGLTTFTHTGAGANVQSRYYYVQTKFGAGGSSSSSSSDTLRSIFLNVNQGFNPDVKLTYNNLHIPKLPTSADNFNISKEFPAGNWSTLGTTPLLNYSDTLSICSASINYQVSLPDNSGCVSLSNIQGGEFFDRSAPLPPEIDSISVLPNGQTVIAWKIPSNMDIDKYRIYYTISGIHNPIDSVSGRNNTIYTYTTTTANNQPVLLSVASMDSCENLGIFHTGFTTMFLKSTYNTCDYSTELSWNPYLKMSKGVSEYKIYYSENGGAFVPVGSTTGTSFTHKNVAPSQNLCYFVRVFNQDKSITSSSNRVCFFSTQPQAPAFVYIKSASISGENSAEIKIYLDISKNVTGIDLSRSADGVNYGNIAFLPFNGGDTYSFTDEGIEPSSTSYYYRAVVRDSCGNPRTKSSVSKTILLKVKVDKENIFSKHLTWTDYKGFDGGVSGYNIYRLVNGAGPGSPVATTGPSDTSYTDNVEDEAPNGSEIKYVVEAVEGIGNTYGFMEKSLSNEVRIYMEDKIFIPTAFAPKGVNKIWLPVTHFVDKLEYSVSIFNRWGTKVFETVDDKEGWNGDGSPPDVYVYLIRYKNSRGEYKELKGTFVLLE